jgi:dTDP-4-amino-4,6-dideoxygalactose transaminase
MLDADEIAAVTEVLSGTVLVHGPKTKAFEAAFAARIGARFAVGVSSCTAALHLALHVEGIGPGDEVIVPAMTHVATAHAASFCGATPVFADVLPDSGNLDPDAVAAVRTGRTRAVMPVHYLGLPCAMDRIAAVAGDALLIEDCALALDAMFGGRKAGTLGRAGCFSFYPVKHMTTVEGGMLTTDDEDLARRVAQARAFGYDRALGERAKPGIYDVTVLGYNYRMNEVAAAVGLAQIAKLDRFQQARAANFAALRDALADIEEVTVFAPTQGRAVSSHYCLNAVLPRDGRIDRDAVIAALAARGVGASVHYPKAVPLMAYYRERYGHRDGAFPVAEWLAAQSVSLPVGPHLKPGDPARIAAALKDAVREGRRA